MATGIPRGTVTFGTRDIGRALRSRVRTGLARATIMAVSLTATGTVTAAASITIIAGIMIVTAIATAATKNH